MVTHLPVLLTLPPSGRKKTLLSITSAPFIMEIFDQGAGLPRNVCQGIFVFGIWGRSWSRENSFPLIFRTACVQGICQGILFLELVGGTLLMRFVLRILCSPDTCCEDYVPRFLGTGGSMFTRASCF
jgi:hypothetical protein